MIIHTEAVIHTDVEDLFLREMVSEDTEFIILGENDYDALDDIISQKSTGLFDADEIDPEDMIDDDEDLYY